MRAWDRARQIQGLIRESSRSFLGRAGIIFFGSVSGQAVTFVMLPLTARIYPADALGRAATILAIVSISAFVIFLQYDQAVVVSHDAELPYILLLSGGIAMAWVGLLAGVLLVDFLLTSSGHTRSLASWGIDWQLPILITSYASFTLLTNVGLRRNQLSRVSVARTINYGGAALLQVLCGLWFGGKESVFLLAQAAASFTAAAWLFPYRETARWRERIPPIRQIAAEIGRIGQIYAKFPQYQMGANLLNAISIYMPVVFLRIAFSDAWAGWYFMAWRMLASPTTLISQAIGQVFYRDSAERERAGLHQGQLVENVVFGLFRVTVLPSVMLGISAPILVQTFLGQAWAPVASIIQVLLISTVVSFFTSPVSMLLNVKGLQAGALSYNFALLLCRVLALGIGWFLQSAFISISMYSVATLMLMLLFCHYIIQSCGGSSLRIAMRALPLGVDAILVLGLAALLWAAQVLHRPFAILALSLAFCAAIWRDIHRGGWRSSSKVNTA